MIFLGQRIIAQEQAGGFAEGPAQMGIADIRIVKAEPCSPLPNQFVRHNDIALSQQIFDVA